MKHLILIIGMAITCVLAATANLVLARMVGINVFTFKIWFLVPAGAIIVGMLGTSGAILAARYFNIHPSIIDAVFMVIVAAATMALIYYLDYATLVLDDGRKASDLVGFGDYVDLMLTKEHLRVGRGQVDAGEVGRMGYLFALVEFVGFLAGGAASFGLIRALPRCGDCGDYLKRLKTKTTAPLTVDEASNMIELLKQGDLAMVNRVMAWAPPARSVDRERAAITFDLYGCSKCKTEAIFAKVKVFNGREWKKVSSLETRRNLVSGLSLRDQFA